MENNKPNEAVQNDEELNTEESAELSDEELEGVNGGGVLLNTAMAGIMMMSAAAPTITAAAERPPLVETYSPEESDKDSILNTVDDSFSGMKAECSALGRISVSSAGVRKENGLVYPFKKYNYLIEIDGHEVGGFSEVSAPVLSNDPIEYRTEESVKQPDIIRYGNIILKSGNTSSTAFYDWCKGIMEGRATRKTITITLVDDTGAGVAMWQVNKACPIKFTVPDNNASSDMAIEIIELAHDGITRIK